MIGCKINAKLPFTGHAPICACWLQLIQFKWTMVVLLLELFIKQITCKEFNSGTIIITGQNLFFELTMVGSFSLALCKIQHSIKFSLLATNPINPPLYTKLPSINKDLYLLRTLVMLCIHSGLCRLSCEVQHKFSCLFGGCDAKKNRPRRAEPKFNPHWLLGCILQLCFCSLWVSFWSRCLAENIQFISSWAFYHLFSVTVFAFCKVKQGE